MRVQYLTLEGWYHAMSTRYATAFLYGNVKSYITWSVTPALGVAPVRQIAFVKPWFKEKHKDTQGLMTRLMLKECWKYVLSANVEVGDGLTHGTPCILKHIVWGRLENDQS